MAKSAGYRRRMENLHPKSAGKGKWGRKLLFTEREGFDLGGGTEFESDSEESGLVRLSPDIFSCSTT